MSSLKSALSFPLNFEILIVYSFYIILMNLSSDVVTNQITLFIFNYEHFLNHYFTTLINSD
jgi:hypothetical protein